MEMTSRISRQLLLWIVVWFLVLGLVLALSGYWEMRILKSSIYEYLQQTLKQQSFEAVEQALKSVSLIFWQVLAGSLVVVGFFLWLTLRSSLMRVLRKDEAAVPPTDAHDPSHRWFQSACIQNHYTPCRSGNVISHTSLQ